MPNELLIISTNALATPPSEHGRYIPDISNEELIRSLSLNNPSFVDLNTLVSPNDNPTIPNMIDAKPHLVFMIQYNPHLLSLQDIKITHH
jgi:hypothetical protein